MKISHNRSCNSDMNLEKKQVLTISAKYLHIYGINPAIKESHAKKWQQPIAEKCEFDWF